MKANGQRSKIRPSKDHCIGNIGTLEFIKAKNSCFLSNIRCNEWYGIHVCTMLKSQFMKAFVDVLHEIVEVYSRSSLDIRRDGVEKQVHQHCLTTTHIAKQV